MSVQIHPDHSNPGEMQRLAKLLLAAAEHKKDVRIETFGTGPYFVVSDRVAEKVDLNPAKPEDPDKQKPKGKKRKDQS